MENTVLKHPQEYKTKAESKPNSFMGYLEEVSEDNCPGITYYLKQRIALLYSKVDTDVLEDDKEMPS